MTKRDYDAVVVGSGPNGLAAAITLQQCGLSVLLIEGQETVGGGLRTAELTLPGFLHDVCSAIHPLAVESPFFKTLPLQPQGLNYIYPTIAAAHPFDTGDAAILSKSLADTARPLGADEQSYLDLLEPLINDWPAIVNDILGPLRIPGHPLKMAGFGLKAITAAISFSNKHFKTKEARGLWAGMAAHSILPLSNVLTSAIGLVLMSMGHLNGWPFPRGGSQQISNALVTHFISLGGQIQTGFYVNSLNQLPSSHAVLFDVTPRQLLQIAGHRFSDFYKWQLKRFKYGMGVFKIDWALSNSVPFTASVCKQAGTIHLGNTMEEITASEKMTWHGKHPERPFVLMAQQSVFDASRAPEGKQSVWAYCHVPHGSEKDMTDAIENQVERFAPGFKDSILDRHCLNSMQMQAYNSNYIGGDINGGVINLSQLFTRPALRFSPYRTSAKGIYICSSSAPPGGGVHGMCGYHAARRALKDIFNLQPLARL